MIWSYRKVYKSNFYKLDIPNDKNESVLLKTPMLSGVYFLLNNQAGRK